MHTPHEGGRKGSSDDDRNFHDGVGVILLRGQKEILQIDLQRLVLFRAPRFKRPDFFRPSSAKMLPIF